MIKITQLINAKAARHKVKEKIYKDIAHYVIIITLPVITENSYSITRTFYFPVYPDFFFRVAEIILPGTFVAIN